MKAKKQFRENCKLWKKLKVRRSALSSGEAWPWAFADVMDLTKLITVGVDAEFSEACLARRDGWPDPNAELRTRAGTEFGRRAARRKLRLQHSCEMLALAPEDLTAEIA